VVDHVEVSGLRIAYERRGSGPAVVLLHGFVGDGCSTWSPQLEDLSGDFTVVAWDAPGAGRSADPPATFRSPDYADCLAAFVSALGLGRPHVVGLSSGGVFALELAGRHPDVVRSLVLAGGYAGWAGSLGPAAAEQRLQFCLHAADLPPGEFVDALLPSMFADPSAGYAAEFGASMRGFSPAGFRSMARSCAEADLRHVLGGLGVPTLVLHGEHDVRARRAVADALHDAIPGSRLVVLPGAGHVSSLEAPRQFTREVRDFLATVPAD
jgi:pimeloyl-ACP methyl ester carboxylesterase